MEVQAKIIDKISHETLFTCNITEIEKAYRYASELEEMGLDVYVEAPGVTKTLSNALGLTDEDEEQYEQSILDEMDDHAGSCCFSKPPCNECPDQ